MALYLPTYVKAPTVTPLPYGLMSVVQMPTDDDDRVHWKNGIQYQRETCKAAESTIAQCPVVTGFGKTPTVTGVQTKGAQPFTVYASITCSPVGNWWEEAEARTVNALTEGEARAVEQVFWTGQIQHPSGSVIYPHLAANAEVHSGDGIILLQPAALTPVTGAVDIVEAVGILESRLGTCYGSVGVIHAPREALAHMSANFLIEKSGQQIRTEGGTLVAFGAGYPGTSPAGVQPPSGTVWLYGTGAITLRRSEITLTSNRVQGLDRSVNTLQLFAERTYVIGWDCCLFAIPVTLGGVTTGAVGSAT